MDVQASRRKDKYHANLLPSFREAQLRKGRDWQDENSQIGSNVKCAVEVPQESLGDTAALDGGVPEGTNGQAVQESAEDGPEPVDNDDGNENSCCEDEFGCWEDAEIE